mmetsp:Transcript_25072/g.69895  ORF Transcript_25072/g.69895 Transcript_25072/m.69895 type:complete len:174 (+) Transcript_25072:78-599(+)
MSINCMHAVLGLGVKLVAVICMYNTLIAYSSAPLTFGAQPDSVLAPPCSGLFIVLHNSMLLYFIATVCNAFCLAYVAFGHIYPPSLTWCPPCACLLSYGSCFIGWGSIVVTVWGSVAVFPTSKGRFTDCDDMYVCAWYAFSGMILYFLLTCCCEQCCILKDIEREDEKLPLTA